MKLLYLALDHPRRSAPTLAALALPAAVILGARVVRAVAERVDRGVCGFAVVTDGMGTSE